jgi:transposase
MPFDSAQIVRLGGAWGAMGALADSDGSAHHQHLRGLNGGIASMRDLTDAVHYICMLHGRHPGAIDHALAQARTPLERDWIEAAAEAFVTERGFLVRLVAAAGPLPSTPGQAECEAVAAAQRHAMDMLAQSARAGCATGAAVAVVLDWSAVRPVLDNAADRLGIDAPAGTLPLAEETVTVVDTLAREGAMERAMLFGAQQVFAQHRGLWDLLEARSSARARA